MSTLTISKQFESAIPRCRDWNYIAAISPETTLHLEPVKLVHAALIFEHAGIIRCLDNTLAMVAPEGRVSVVLQLPGKPGHEISPTGFPAMQRLKPEFTLIDPAELQKTLEARNWTLEEQLQVPLPAEKGLWMGIFHRNL